MTKICFIVAAYNAEKYLGRCLDSLCGQSEKDIQIVVVNDGSTDKTSEIAENYVKRDNRLKLYHQENQGLVLARKRGLEEAEAEFVMFVDADDWIAEDTAECLEATLLETNADMVVPGIFYAFKNHAEPHSVQDRVYDGLDYFEMLMVEKVPHHVSSCLYRKKLFDRVPWNVCRELYMGEDLALNILLTSQGLKVVTLNRNLYYYYQNPVSMSHMNYEKIIRVYDALDAIQLLLKQRGMLEHYRQQMDFLYYLHGIHYHGIMPFQKNYNVRRKLRDRWREQHINIYQNPYYQEFAKGQPIGKRVFMVAYRYSFYLNYILGVIVMPVFNKVKGR